MRPAELGPVQAAGLEFRNELLDLRTAAAPPHSDGQALFVHATQWITSIEECTGGLV
jgi:hypothetical protein